MTKLLEEAIAKIRELPEEDQDNLAMAILLMASSEEPYPLDDEARLAIEEGMAQARRGEFVSDAEMEQFWARHGL